MSTSTSSSSTTESPDHRSDVTEHHPPEPGTPDHDPDLLEVGRIGRPHGVRGEVMVTLSSDRTERLEPGSRLQCRGVWLTVVRSTPHTNRWRVRFEGIDDRSAAERLTSATLLAEPLDDPDALWVHELIGAEVVDVSGAVRGRCVAVVQNPAADLLELDTGALVPVAFVVSTEPEMVVIDTPEGLFELFAPDS
jgi:16S rRNA processing protein RimM